MHEKWSVDHCGDRQQSCNADKGSIRQHILKTPGVSEGAGSATSESLFRYRDLEFVPSVENETSHGNAAQVDTFVHEAQFVIIIRGAGDSECG